MSYNPFGKLNSKVISRPVNRRKPEKNKVALHESNAGFEVKIENTTHFARRTVNSEKRCGFVSMKTFNVIMCGVVFALLFTAFTPTQVRKNRDLRFLVWSTNISNAFFCLESASYVE